MTCIRRSVESCLEIYACIGKLIRELDLVLIQLVVALLVDIIPGPHYPANFSLLQQPLKQRNKKGADHLKYRPDSELEGCKVINLLQVNRLCITLSSLKAMFGDTSQKGLFR